MVCSNTEVRRGDTELHGDFYDTQRSETQPRLSDRFIS